MWNLLLLSSDWSCVTWWDSSILIGCCGWNTSAHWHVSVVDCESLKAPRLWGVLWIHHTASAQMFRPLQSRPQRGSGRSPRWPAMVTQWFPRQPQRSVPRRHQVVVRTSVFFFGLVCLNYFNVEQRWVLKISSLWTFTVLVHSWKLIHQYWYSYQYFLAFVVLSETLNDFFLWTSPIWVKYLVLSTEVWS